jgi:hypothetical protein
MANSQSCFPAMSHSLSRENPGIHETLDQSSSTNPRTAGAIDAMREFVPANHRAAIPFEGLDRLLFWQGRRAAEETKRRHGESRAGSPDALRETDPQRPQEEYTFGCGEA